MKEPRVINPRPLALLLDADKALFDCTKGTGGILSITVQPKAFEALGGGRDDRRIKVAGPAGYIEIRNDAFTGVR